MGQLSHRRARVEKQHFQRVLREFHHTADLNLIVSQLQGKETLVGLRPPAEFTFKERQRLATSLFQETTDHSFTRIVEDLCLLCTRQEQSCSDRGSLSQTSFSDQHTLENAASAKGPSMEAQPYANSRNYRMAIDSDCHTFSDNQQPQARFNLVEDIVVEYSELPITSILRKQRSRRRTCLFCDGDRKDGRSRTFARTSTLRQHYQNVHFAYEVGCFLCPVPDCQRMIQDRNRFANHAVAVHDNDISIRTTLKESIKRNKKPDKSPEFTLQSVSQVKVY